MYDVKVKQRCRITEEYWRSAHKDLSLIISKITLFWFCFKIYKIMITNLCFRKLGNLNSCKFCTKTIERYLNFTTEQSKKDVINPGLSLIFIDSVNFLNDSLDNLVKSLSEDEFYDLTEKYKAYM